MNRALKVLAFFISCLAGSGQFVCAQAVIQFEEVSGPAVLVQGQPLTEAWTGGFNSPQFSAIDLNQDGQQDLFVFDRSSQRVFTFLAVQTNGQWQYQYAPQYEVLFPAGLRVFALLRDYNQDGAPDLFTATNQGMRVYKNTSAMAGKVAFDLTYPVLFYNTDVNVMVGSEDLPAITDMDGDGDVDVLMWEWSGGTKLEYFQNQQVEQNLPPDELKFTKASSWYGQVTRCKGTCNSYKFNDQCASSHHVGGSSLLPLDVDGNGVLDLVVGHDDCPDLVSLMNTGTTLLPKITSAQYNLPPDITGDQFSVFPAAYYLDVTFDGVPDLVVAPNSTTNSHRNVDLSTSTWYYANTGTAAQPRFEGTKQPFLQHQMIDVGEGAAPALGRLTGGSGLDLLVGNAAVLKEDQYVATLSLFQNSPTPQGTQFNKITDDYLGFAALKLLNLKLQLVDLNQDGAHDLVYSAYNQQTNAMEFKYLLNQAAAGEPAQFSLSGAVPITGVLLFNGDTPYLYDVDADGNLDLLIGRSSGALHYYQNSGTFTAPSWNLVSESLGGIAANTERRRLQISVADLDQDGQPDLMTTDDSGQLRLYPEFRLHLSGTFQEAGENLLWQPLLQQYSSLKFGTGMTVASGNVDQNGALEVMVGTHTGGLRFLKVTAEPLSAGESESPVAKVQLFPNPAQGYTQLVTEKAASFVVYNLAGTKMAEGKTKAQEVQIVSTQTLPAGLYLLRITFRSGQIVTQKLVVQR